MPEIAETTPATPAAPPSLAIVPAYQDEGPAGAESGSMIAAFSSERDFAAGQRIARALGSSTLVPEAYRGNIPNVMIAMELANRMDCSVFMIMQNMDLIHGRPAWSSKFLIATANACGRFTPIRFRWSGDEGTDARGCRAVAKDRETGEECIGALVTLAIAKAEGWYTKNGSKWKTMPEQMTMYRAAAFWTRIYAPELSMGFLSSEEAVDIGPEGQPNNLPTLPTAGRPEGQRMSIRPATKAVVVDVAPPMPPHNPETGEVTDVNGVPEKVVVAETPPVDPTPAAPAPVAEKPAPIVAPKEAPAARRSRALPQSEESFLADIAAAQGPADLAAVDAASKEASGKVISPNARMRLVEKIAARLAELSAQQGA